MTVLAGFWGIVLGAALIWVGRALVLECRRDRIPILCYHRFVAKAAVESGEVADAEMGWVCYDETLRGHLDYLDRNGYTTLDLDALLEIQAGRQVRPKRPVVLTMDDGYRSNYSIAFPLLRERGQVATIYVALEPDAHTRGQVSGVDSFLNEEELREMSRFGISIQSHTLTHSILTELSDEAVDFELHESRRRLEEILGLSVEHVCFPRGGVDRRIRRAAVAAGYRSASGASPGTFSGISSPHNLPRIMIDRDMGVGEFRKLLESPQRIGNRLTGELKGALRSLIGARRMRRWRDVLYQERFHSWVGAARLRRAVAASIGLSLILWVSVGWWVLHSS
ncbi:MAG: polysaccharide deacetylase family protein [Myxococcota bacterium]|nr:polysaccharide deacetylase family protein [Myxococcota bacterium]